MTYYNTNKEIGEQLEESRAKAESQERIIMGYFRRRYKALFTAEDCHKWFSDHTPITSVRRALTNLTKEGLLVKTSAMKEGMYGKQIHCYTLPNGQTSLFD